MREFFKTKKDIEERIRNNVRNIAFYADNLTKKDCILVDSFLKSAEKKYDINYHICEVKNILHDNTNFYKPYVPKNNWPVGYLWNLPIYYCVTKYGSLIMDMTIIS